VQAGPLEPGGSHAEVGLGVRLRVRREVQHASGPTAASAARKVAPSTPRAIRNRRPPASTNSIRASLAPVSTAPKAASSAPRAIRNRRPAANTNSIPASLTPGASLTINSQGPRLVGFAPSRLVAPPIVCAATNRTGLPSVSAAGRTRGSTARSATLPTWCSARTAVFPHLFT